MAMVTQVTLKSASSFIFYYIYCPSKLLISINSLEPLIIILVLVLSVISPIGVSISKATGLLGIQPAAAHQFLEAVDLRWDSGCVLDQRLLLPASIPDGNTAELRSPQCPLH